MASSTSPTKSTTTSCRSTSTYWHRSTISPSGCWRSAWRQPDGASFGATFFLVPRRGSSASTETRIVGIDIQLSPIVRPEDFRNVTLEICDQNDTAHLTALATQFGPFDIIIEDGCHRYAESRACCRALFEHVRVGGFYVIEDWAIGFMRSVHHAYGGPNGGTMVDLVSEILRGGPEGGICDAQIVLEQYFRSGAFFRWGHPYTAP